MTGSFGHDKAAFNATALQFLFEHCLHLQSMLIARGRVYDESQHMHDPPGLFCCAKLQVATQIDIYNLQNAALRFDTERRDECDGITRS